MSKQMYAEFSEFFPFCMACEFQPVPVRELGLQGYMNRLENAHIVGGSGRRADRRCIVRLCNAHHRAQEGERLPFTKEVVLFGMNIENMLWLKRNFDPGFYDLEFIKSLRHKKAEPLTPKGLPSNAKVHRNHFANPLTYMESDDGNGDLGEKGSSPSASRVRKDGGDEGDADGYSIRGILRSYQAQQKEQITAQEFEGPVEIMVINHRKRPCDSEGISAKGAIDGLVHAGVIKDDSLEYVTETRHRQVKSKEEKTVLILTEAIK